MNSTARSTETPRLVHWLLAPAHWLERTRGRKRLALLMLYTLIAAVAGLFVWRAASLNGLPDVGDPFDVEAFGNVSVPEEENAFTLYEQAAAKLVPFKGAARARFTPDWSAADPAYRRWAEANGEAMEIWLRGTRRERAVYIRPKDLRFETPMPVAQALRGFAQIGLLEASRREQAGDMAGAWEMYRAVLVTSRHVGLYGCAIQRLIGAAFLRQSLGPIQRWANDPRVDAALLRRALGDVRECEAMTPPPSEMVKVEYLSFMAALDRPTPWVSETLKEANDGAIWYHHLPRATEFKRWLKRDPERSRRVARLIFANWLAYCDRPPSQRATIRFWPSNQYYRVGPDAPASARALDPEAIDRWLRTTEFTQAFLPALDSAQARIDGDPRLFASLRVSLAEECFAREHGGLPKRLGELVGPYLDALPDGFEPDDAPPTPDMKNKP